ncbi:MAG: hypothetical protein U1E05_15955 [Patescibacteria group bacterium]|nr:hypothetical protein [Patescibacteria group bacterium]
MCDCADRPWGFGITTNWQNAKAVVDVDRGWGLEKGAGKGTGLEKGTGAILFGTRFVHFRNIPISRVARSAAARIIPAWLERNGKKSVRKTSRA